MKTVIKLDTETWQEKYVLTNNVNDRENASWQDEDGNGAMYETYGDDLLTIFEVNRALQNHVWTYGDGDNGGTYIVNGYSRVNVIGYFITKNAWADGEIIIVEVSPEDSTKESK